MNNNTFFSKGISKMTLKWSYKYNDTKYKHFFQKKKNC